MSDFEQPEIEQLRCANIQLLAQVRELRTIVDALEKAAVDRSGGVLGLDDEFSRTLSNFRRAWKTQRRDDAPDVRERVEKNAGQK